MEVNAALAAELAILTDALDGPGTDVVEGVLKLAADVRTAVASYLGLMVIISDNDPPITLSALENEIEFLDIRASLMLALSALSALPALSALSARSGGAGHDGVIPRASLILFASSPGAFVDLAADLAWMTGHQPDDVGLDQHLTLPDEPARAPMLRTESTVNQAIGLLIGQGHTHEQAHRELDARADDAGTDRHRAADLILTALPVIDGDRDLEID